MKARSFKVTKEVQDLGVKDVTARITGAKNTDFNSDFENYKNLALITGRN